MIRLLVALAVVTIACPAAAQAPVHVPCLEPRPDLASFVASFEAEGWTQAKDEARSQALLGPGELHRLLMLSSQTFGRIPPIEDRATWEDEARATGEDLHEGATVLTRDAATAVLRVLEFDDDLDVTCIITAPDLPEADALIATEPNQLPTFSMVQAEPPLPAGASRLHVVAYRYETPVAPPLAGGEAITVSLAIPANR
jgi:hypothetical protein